MSPINRREFLEKGFTLAGAAALGAYATACTQDLGFAPVSSPAMALGRGLGVPDLLEPRVIASQGGILSANIVAATQPTNVAGRQILRPVTYNGTFPGAGARGPSGSPRRPHVYEPDLLRRGGYEARLRAAAPGKQYDEPALPRHASLADRDRGQHVDHGAHQRAATLFLPDPQYPSRRAVLVPCACAWVGDEPCGTWGGGNVVCRKRIHRPDR